LQYFSRVYANVGGSYGDSEFDKRLPRNACKADSHYLGSPADAGWGSKDKLIRKCMQERGLEYEQVIFIDDTASEISHVRGLCHVLHVQPPEGMSADDLAHLRGLVAGIPPAEAPALRASNFSAFSEVSAAGAAGAPPQSAESSLAQPGGASGPNSRTLGEQGSQQHPLPAGMGGAGQAAQADEEWWGTAPPPPPPPPKRTGKDKESFATPSPVSGISAQDHGSFVRIGMPGSEYGAVPPGQSPSVARERSKQAGRPPSNLYGDGDPPTPLCSWLVNNQGNGKGQPACTLM